MFLRFVFLRFAFLICNFYKKTPCPGVGILRMIPVQPQVPEKKSIRVHPALTPPPGKKDAIDLITASDKNLDQINPE